jgi:hypothetical protein
MTRYRYDGPVSSVTLSGGLDVNLHPGAEVELPEDNDYVGGLVAKGFLTPLPKTAPKPSKKEDEA